MQYNAVQYQHHAGRYQDTILYKHGCWLCQKVPSAGGRSHLNSSLCLMRMDACLHACRTHSSPVCVPTRTNDLRMRCSPSALCATRTCDQRVWWYPGRSVQGQAPHSCAQQSSVLQAKSLSEAGVRQAACCSCRVCNRQLVAPAACV